jgi:surface antigen
MRHLIIIVTAASLTLAGCATTGGGVPPTAVQRAQGQCIASVAVGALLGAVIGNNTGSGNASRGAGRGALVGAGICAVLLAMASEEDRRRIQEAEYAALETGQPREDVYVGSDGKQRTILVRTEAAPDKSWTFTPAASDAAQPAAAVVSSTTDICRYRQTTLTVQDTGSGTLDRELVCRNPQTRAWEVQRSQPL